MSTAHIGAVIAAEEQRRRQLEEEEKLSRYTTDELNQEWEFKIVRSSTGAFRKKEFLARVIQEESLGGWVMLEKFDNARIRFKRPLGSRSRDHLLPQGYDPYRTSYGSNASPVLVLIALGIVLLLGAGVAFALMSGIRLSGSPMILMALSAGVLGVLLIGLVVVLFNRK